MKYPGQIIVKRLGGDSEIGGSKDCEILTNVRARDKTPNYVLHTPFFIAFVVRSCFLFTSSLSYFITNDEREYNNFHILL